MAFKGLPPVSDLSSHKWNNWKERKLVKTGQFVCNGIQNIEKIHHNFFFNKYAPESHKLIILLNLMAKGTTVICYKKNNIPMKTIFHGLVHCG
jgi:hypothetical protein